MSGLNVPQRVQERVAFGLRAFVTGIDEAGRLYNHNRWVGIGILLAILGIGFFPVDVGLMYRIPLATGAVALMTLNGAFVEYRKYREAHPPALVEPEDAEITAGLSRFSQHEQQQMCDLKRHILTEPILSNQEWKPVLEKMTRHKMCHRERVDQGTWPNGAHKGFRDRYSLTAFGEGVLEKLCADAFDGKMGA